MTGNTAYVTIAVGEKFVNDVDLLDLPDGEEEDAPGAKLVWNNDDDNDNGVPDYLEIDGNVANEDDLIELTLDPYVREDYDPQDLYLRFDAGARVWDSPEKGREIVLNDWLRLDELPASVWLEGVTEGGDSGSTATILQAEVNYPFNASPGNQQLPVNSNVPLDDVRTRPVANLTAYRPMPEHEKAISLGERAVLQHLEDDEDFGPGIRLNTDFDAGVESQVDYSLNGYAGENDLIKVEVAPAYAGQQLAFRTVSANFTIWASASKPLDPILSNGGESDVLTQSTYYVEWASADHGSAVLELVDLGAPQGQESQDTLLFHTFESLIVAFSGETLDGSMIVAPFFDFWFNRRFVAAGDQRVQDIAIQLYEAGYDIQYFDVWDHDAVDVLPALRDRTLAGPAVVVAENAIRNRQVTDIGIFGWSHGGGAAYALDETLTNLTTGIFGDLPDTFTIKATAYIDAILYKPYTFLGIFGFGESLVPAFEFRRPIGTEFHANWYQTTFEPFAGIQTVEGEADVEEDLTDDLEPGDRHTSIVDKVFETKVLFDLFIDKIKKR